MMFGEVQIWVDLTAIQLVEIDAAGAVFGSLARGHKAEHAAQYTAPGGSTLFVRTGMVRSKS